MNPLLQIDEQTIELLDDHQLADIVNRLLKAEAQRYGIPPFAVKTTLLVDNPDGGIDARVEHSMAVPATCRIPDGISVWQYKVSKVPPKEIREVESQKPSVQEAIQAGSSYFFVIGKGCSDIERKNREEAVNSCYAERGLTPKGHLLTAQDVADWVCDYPSIGIHPCFRRPVHDELFSFEKWQDLPELRVRYLAFEKDTYRQTVIDEIAKAATKRTGFVHIRVAGRAGIGKTRLVLEAVQASGTDQLTLYARSREGIPPTLFSYLEGNPNERLTLVADECDFQEAVRLQSRAQMCGDRLLLITIGHDPLPSGAQTEFPIFWLEKLDDEAVGRIVRNISRTMPTEVVSFVVRTSSGYVKLATAMAEALVRNPGIVGASQLVGVPDVRVILESLVPNSADRRAMEGLSLLRHVGMEGDAAVEGQAIAKFVGIEFRELQRAAYEMRRTGLVVKRGRYCYVTPHLLAVWFATQAWQAMRDNIVNDLLYAEGGLPSIVARKALLERLADLGEEEIATPIVERLLGADGLFPGVEELDDSFRSEVFATLARAAPRTGAAALERILGHLPRDRLIEFRAGRRRVVWTLDGLVGLADTFWTAAHLLLKLAEAENETYGNNATGIWREIFYTHLSGTPIPAVERHRLIEEALQGSLVETRLLAVQAIQAALSTFESRAVVSNIGGHIVQPTWSPKTWGEFWEVRRSALKLLDQALTDQEPQVVAAAREVLENSVRGLVRERLANDALPRLMNLPAQTEPERLKKWESLQSLLHYEKEALTEEQKALIQQWSATLLGNSFHDQLQRWVGKVSLVDRVQTDKSVDEMAAKMAEEGYQNPDSLRTELGWLASSEAQQFYAFGRRLGQLDSEHVWLNDLAQVTKGGNAGLLTAYLQGLSDSGQSEWVEQRLDEWAENQEMSSAVFDATWRRGGSDNGAKRLVELVDKGWLPVPQLGWLSWGGWPKSVSAEAIVAILQRIVQDESPQSTEGGLALLLQWLEEHRQQDEVVAEYALRLLERTSAIQSQGMLQFYWVQIATFYLARFAAQTVLAILEVFATSDFLTIREDQRMEVMQEALIHNPDIVWPLVGEFLLRRDDAGYRLRLSMRGWGLEGVNVALLIKWAEDHEPDGAHILAELARVSGTPLSPLPRQLLIKYGKDENIGNALKATFVSGSWWGSEAQWLKTKLDTARNWLNDEHLAVRSWARHVVKHLDADIERTRRREEEEELLD